MALRVPRAGQSTGSYFWVHFPLHLHAFILAAARAEWVFGNQQYLQMYKSVRAPLMPLLTRRGMKERAQTREQPLTMPVCLTQ